MPKGRRAGLGLGDYQEPGAFRQTVRDVFMACLRMARRDVVEELAEVTTTARARAWARRWNIEADWILDIALRTGQAWSVSPIELRHLVVAQAATSGVLVPEPAGLSPWAPTIETEAAFRARVDTYIADTKRWAAEQFLVPDTERRHLKRDAEALVSYQVCVWDFDAVMEEYFDGLSNDAARKALSQLAADLPLTLRKQ